MDESVTKVFVMLPLDTINAEGKFMYASTPWFKRTLQFLTSSGVHGVALDVWWGAVEQQPRRYVWTGYQQLFELLRRFGLKIQVVLSFHACGGNVGDSVQIPLPRWVLECGATDPDIFFTDQPRQSGLSHRNAEYISIWADEEPGILAGRSPLHCYEDLMRSFRDTFILEIGTLIEDIVIGTGPCGELRLPSYVAAHGWVFPGIGEFQCYDRRALAALASAARAVGRPEWGYSGPPNAGHYNSTPEDAPFFQEHQWGGYDSDYGKFFLTWYSQALIHHGDLLLSAARRVFPLLDDKRNINSATNTVCNFEAEIRKETTEVAEQDNSALISHVIKDTLKTPLCSSEGSPKRFDSLCLDDSLMNSLNIDSNDSCIPRDYMKNKKVDSSNSVNINNTDTSLLMSGTLKCSDSSVVRQEIPIPSKVLMEKGMTLSESSPYQNNGINIDVNQIYNKNNSVMCDSVDICNNHHQDSNGISQSLITSNRNVSRQGKSLPVLGSVTSDTLLLSLSASDFVSNSSSFHPSTSSVSSLSSSAAVMDGQSNGILKGGPTHAALSSASSRLGKTCLNITDNSVVGHLNGSMANTTLTDSTMVLNVAHDYLDNNTGVLDTPGKEITSEDSKGRSISNEEGMSRHNSKMEPVDKLLKSSKTVSFNVLEEGVIPSLQQNLTLGDGGDGGLHNGVGEGGNGLL
eukprot:CAMPEP_0175042908 /NCGR_PEP_ID=MMETSP0052_2-20121109/2854_1 /TAXON_ID=51329 ORGANISM="Polytomella parva, Strain SAG 63-3" /NCGR_SAMPLE_ID=MMETSP0052_2 /ASSEMBLY_ACC=CAM_ASM_000194 /LENGTH=686 /DNA_ID=CAMNT_0016305831 /DNA_START=125 /DNA_END=2182 /DNA_ORIENTATION=+